MRVDVDTEREVARLERQSCLILLALCGPFAIWPTILAMRVSPPTHLLDMVLGSLIYFALFSFIALLFVGFILWALNTIMDFFSVEFNGSGLIARYIGASLLTGVWLASYDLGFDLTLLLAPFLAPPLFFFAVLIEALARVARSTE